MYEYHRRRNPSSSLLEAHGMAAVEDYSELWTPKFAQRVAIAYAFALQQEFRSAPLLSTDRAWKGNHLCSSLRRARGRIIEINSVASGWTSDKADGLGACRARNHPALIIFHIVATIFLLKRKFMFLFFVFNFHQQKRWI